MFQKPEFLEFDFSNYMIHYFKELLLFFISKKASTKSLKRLFKKR